MLGIVDVSASELIMICSGFSDFGWGMFIVSIQFKLPVE
jgi:hypothetical protein